MKVLVLGSGAKDHAIAWWFSKSKLIDGLFVAPGNPGTADFAVNLPTVDTSDKEAVLKVCKKYGVNFVFIGTEEPLFTGVIDFLNSNGIATFGAPGYAIKLEGDRKFAKEFATRNGVNVPSYQVFNNEKELSEYLKKNKDKMFAIKPNGLSPSRLMVNSSDYDTLMEFAKKQIAKKEDVILEESLDGLCLTISLLLDEKGALPLPVCSEYTKSEHGEAGVITGGLGAVCPVPVSDEIKLALVDKVIKPTLQGLKKEQMFYKGILTFSVIMQGNEPYLVDFHVRLNDPAAQTFVPLIKNDLVEIMMAMQNNTLGSIKLETSEKCSVSVVIASEGYPVNPKVGVKLDTVKGNFMNNSLDTKPYLFFGAVEDDGKGSIITNGGRAATFVGVGDSIVDANAAVYGCINSVSFKGAWHREDVGNKFFVSAT